jgi:hypothetical protein
MQLNTKLSPHFTFGEVTLTQNRALLRQNRACALNYITELTLLCNYILEPARALLKTPLIITGGYRCPALNKALRGEAASQHLLGQAADFLPLNADIETAFNALKKSGLIGFGQLILEPAWLHISLGAPFRPLAKCAQSFKV